MILNILVLICAYWITAATLAFIAVNKAFKKYKKYPKIEVPSHYQGFMRQDFGKWNQKVIKAGCFLRFPFKFASFATYLIVLSILSMLHNHIKLPVFIVELWRRNMGKFANKMIFKLAEHFDQSEQIDTPVIIANHSSLFDPNYLASCFRCVSVIVKAEAKKTPLFSEYMKYSDCLFVDRDASGGRSTIFTQIKKRVQNFQTSKGSTYPILIFPEGTVSNGRAIMQFKNGAFDALTPITIFSLRYECEQFHMAQDEVDTLFFTIIVLCLNSKLIVKRQKVTPQQKQTVEQYRERCRKLVGQMCDFPLYECNFSDFREYSNMVKEAKKINNQKKVQ